MRYKEALRPYYDIERQVERGLKDLVGYKIMIECGTIPIEEDKERRNLQNFVIGLVGDSIEAAKLFRENAIFQSENLE